MTATTTAHGDRARRPTYSSDGPRHGRPARLLAPRTRRPGRTLADSKGTSPATLTGGDASACPARSPATRTPRSRFNGTSDFAQAPRRTCRRRSTLTVEFWLKWNAYANDDAPGDGVHAELQRQQRRLPGRPERRRAASSASASASAARATTCSSHGRAPASGTTTRIVLDTTAPAATQITPYVDGAAGRVHKSASGTGAGHVRQLDAVLHVARAAPRLFGAGDLDELAIYNTALTARPRRRALRGGQAVGRAKETRRRNRWSGMSRNPCRAASRRGRPPRHGRTDALREKLAHARAGLAMSLATFAMAAASAIQAVLYLELVRHQRAHRRLLRRVRAVHDVRRLQPEPAADLGAAAGRATGARLSAREFAATLVLIALPGADRHGPARRPARASCSRPASTPTGAR